MTKDELNKMIRIAKTQTGGSLIYAEMLLSMIPNSKQSVRINEWNYKADRDDFNIILELMKQSNTDIIFEYAEMIEPYKKELLDIIKTN